jgi:hypothetical protein
LIQTKLRLLLQSGKRVGSFAEVRCRRQSLGANPSNTRLQQALAAVHTACMPGCDPLAHAAVAARQARALVSQNNENKGLHEDQGPTSALRRSRACADVSILSAASPLHVALRLPGWRGILANCTRSPEAHALRFCSSMTSDSELHALFLLFDYFPKMFNGKFLQVAVQLYACEDSHIVFYEPLSEE